MGRFYNTAVAPVSGDLLKQAAGIGIGTALQKGVNDAVDSAHQYAKEKYTRSVANILANGSTKDLEGLNTGMLTADALTAIDNKLKLQRAERENQLLQNRQTLFEQSQNDRKAKTAYNKIVADQPQQLAVFTDNAGSTGQAKYKAMSYTPEELKALNKVVLPDTEDPNQIVNALTAKGVDKNTAASIASKTLAQYKLSDVANTAKPVYETRTEQARRAVNTLMSKGLTVPDAVYKDVLQREAADLNARSLQQKAAEAQLKSGQAQLKTDLERLYKSNGTTAGRSGSRNGKAANAALMSINNTVEKAKNDVSPWLARLVGLGSDADRIDSVMEVMKKRGITDPVFATYVINNLPVHAPSGNYIPKGQELVNKMDTLTKMYNTTNKTSIPEDWYKPNGHSYVGTVTTGGGNTQDALNNFYQQNIANDKRIIQNANSKIQNATKTPSEIRNEYVGSLLSKIGVQPISVQAKAKEASVSNTVKPTVKKTTALKTPVVKKSAKDSSTIDLSGVKLLHMLKDTQGITSNELNKALTDSNISDTDKADLIKMYQKSKEAEDKRKKDKVRRANADFLKKGIEALTKSPYAKFDNILRLPAEEQKKAIEEMPSYEKNRYYRYLSKKLRNKK